MGIVHGLPAVATELPINNLIHGLLLQVESLRAQLADAKQQAEAAKAIATAAAGSLSKAQYAADEAQAARYAAEEARKTAEAAAKIAAQRLAGKDRLEIWWPGSCTAVGAPLLSVCAAWCA